MYKGKTINQQSAIPSLRMEIGILAERKKPEDNRAGLTPADAAYLKKVFPLLDIVVERSNFRVFKDEEYANLGLQLVTRASTSDILVGVKEVPIEELIPNKTYLFFSHTIKKQPYNKNRLQALVDKNCTLIDYECLEDNKGQRLIGFGKWAGIVGTYNGFRTYFKKHKQQTLSPAHQMLDYDALRTKLKNSKIPEMKIVFTGTGNVSYGIREVLNYLKIKEVSPSTFLNTPSGTIFTQLKDEHLYQRKNGEHFEKQHFFKNHNAYKSIFKPYLFAADLLINGMFWENDMEPLFSKDDLSQDVRIKTIADITCDVEGSIPITWKATTIEDPIIGWDLKTQKPGKPFENNTIDIMSVTNLPSELPKSASEDFSKKMRTLIIPELLNNGKIIKEATLVSNGNICSKYAYLDNWLKG